METGRSLGAGDGIGDAASEYSSASERADRLGADADPREANAAAVAAAASSTVPV